MYGISRNDSKQQLNVSFTKAINDNSVAEAAERVMEIHIDATPRPLFSRVLCASASSAPVFSRVA